MNKLNTKVMNETIIELMRYYLKDEIKNYSENFEHHKMKFNNHILGKWFELIKQLPLGEDYVEQIIHNIRLEMENETLVNDDKLPTF